MPSSHPFQNTTGLLVLIPDKIDVEEESRFYDELCDVRAFFHISRFREADPGMIGPGRCRIPRPLPRRTLGILTRYMAW